MPTIERALLSDFWRRGKWGFLITFPTMTLLPLISYGFLFRELNLEAVAQAMISRGEDSPLITLHVVFTLAIGFCAVTYILGAQGSVKRFYPLPVSTTRLVMCQMSLSAATGAITYLAAAATLNLVAGVNWPLWGPALFFAATVACCQAALWWAQGSVAAQFMALCATGIPLAIWFARRYGATVFGDWKVMWTSPTVEEVLTLAAITAGVARNRRGDSFDFEWVANWFAENFSSSRRAEKFRSPQAAQFWFERQQKLVAVPAGLVGLTVFVVFLPRLTGFADSRDTLEGLFVVGLSILMFVLPLVYGLILGNFGRSSRMFHMTHFVGVRPLSDAALAWSILKTAGVALISAWAVWVVGLALAIGLCWKLEGWNTLVGVLQSFEHPLWHYPVFVLVALPASWALLGTAASWAAAGWPTRMAVLVVGSLFAVAAFIVAGSFMEPHYQARYCEAGFTLLGLALLGVTGWAVARTRLEQTVPERTTWLVVLAWLVVSSVGIVSIVALAKQPLPAAVWICAAGLWSLVVLPFVATPLAVSWNRHR